MAKATGAKSGRKLTKKDLKEDKLVQYAYKAERFFNENRNRVVGAVVVILVLILGGLFLQRMTSESRMVESYDLTIAKMAFGQERYSEARSGFETVLGKYGGQIAAEAKYYMARIDFDQGRFADAEAGFRDYQQNFDGDVYTDCAAEAGLAASLEAQGKTMDAAALYEATAKKYADLPYAPEALGEAARIYMYANQKDSAISVLKRILEDYPDASVATRAKQDLDRLQ